MLFRCFGFGASSHSKHDRSSCEVESYVFERWQGCSGVSAPTPQTGKQLKQGTINSSKLPPGPALPAQHETYLHEGTISSRGYTPAKDFPSQQLKSSPSTKQRKSSGLQATLAALLAAVRSTADSETWSTSSHAHRQTHESTLPTEGTSPSPSNIIELAAVDAQRPASHSTRLDDSPDVLRVVTWESLEAACGRMSIPLALLSFESRHSSEAMPPFQHAGDCSCSSHGPQVDAHAAMLQAHCAWLNEAYVQRLEASDKIDAAAIIDKSAMHNMAINRQVQGFLKRLQLGTPASASFWNMYYHSNAPAEPAIEWMYPCKLLHQGRITFAALLYTEPSSPPSRHIEAMMRDLMCLKYTPWMVTLVDDMGYIIAQNTESCARLGCHAPCFNPDGELGHHMSDLQTLTQWEFNYFEELFLGQEEVYTEMQRVTSGPEPYVHRMKIVSPALCKWLGAVKHHEVWHSVHISRIRDPSTSKPIYCVAQIDITNTVNTERQVLLLQQQQLALLKEVLPQQVIEQLLIHKAMEAAAAAGSNQTSWDAAMPPAHVPNRARESTAACAELRRSVQPCWSATNPASLQPEHPPEHDIIASVDSLPAMHGLVGPLRFAPPGSIAPGARLPTVVSHGSLLLGTRSFQLPGNLSSTNLQSLTDAGPLSSLQDETGRIWLTQQDVMNLATFHEEATILFADIKGFTSMSQQLHPSQVMLFLNTLYSVWDSMLETYGVYKVETIGDCYMVAGGLFCYDQETKSNKLGGYDPQHAHKVLDFAKAMLWASQAIKTPLGETVQIRVGIHAGSCSSGVVGQRMPRFCLFGDTVNTASRMESTGHPGCIHASNAAQKLLCGETWMPTGGVLVKGKGTMQTYLMQVAPSATLPSSIVMSSSLYAAANVRAGPRHSLDSNGTASAGSTPDKTTPSRHPEASPSFALESLSDARAPAPSPMSTAPWTAVCSSVSRLCSSTLLLDSQSLLTTQGSVLQPPDLYATGSSCAAGQAQISVIPLHNTMHLPEEQDSNSRHSHSSRSTSSSAHTICVQSAVAAQADGVGLARRTSSASYSQRLVDCLTHRVLQQLQQSRPDSPVFTAPCNACFSVDNQCRSGGQSRVHAQSASQRAASLDVGLALDLP